MQKRSNKKFCPRCGTPNNIGDAYCIKCGFAFIKRAKKSSSKTFFLILFLLAAAWVFYRTFLKQPILPAEISDLFKNFTIPKLK